MKIFSLLLFCIISLTLKCAHQQQDVELLPISPTPTESATEIPSISSPSPSQLHIKPEIIVKIEKALEKNTWPNKNIDSIKHKKILTPQKEEELLNFAEILKQENLCEKYRSIIEQLAFSKTFKNLSYNAFIKYFTDSDCPDNIYSNNIYNYHPTINNEDYIDFVKRHIKDSAIRDDLKELGFAILNIDKTKIIPEIDANLLGDKEVEIIFQKIELLTSLWEFSLAEKLSIYLLNKKQIPKNPGITKILLQYAKILNQLEQYEKSSSIYKKILSTDKKADVEERFLLSLHYSNKHREEILYLQKKSHKKLSLKNEWHIFWDLYLLKDYKISEKIAKRIISQKNISKEKKVKWNYWLARIYEQTKKTDAAKQLFSEIISTSSQSSYAIWARSRIQKLSSTLALDSGKQAENNLLTETNSLENKINPPELPILESYPLAYYDGVRIAAKELNISDTLILAIMRAESGFNQEAISNVGALGLMQIMPRTGFHISKLLNYYTFSPLELISPATNIAFGSYYLSYLMHYYNNNFILTIAAYNAGPAAVNRWIKQNTTLSLDEFSENIPYDQTYAYVKKVLINMDIYLSTYNKTKIGLTLPDFSALPFTNKNQEIF